jgi:RNA polymerase sigma-70 factor (family 1)
MKQFREPDEEELVQNLRLGDSRAFAMVFETYWLELFHFAEKKIRCREDAEELVQAVFLDLWEKRERLVNVNLHNFLVVCLRNKCVDYLRQKMQEGKYADYCKSFADTTSLSTQEIVYWHDLSDSIADGLTGLPEKSQLVFKLNRFEGLSVKETAEKLNLSEKAVEYHITKALKVMKVRLKDFVLLLAAVLLN